MKDEKDVALLQDFASYKRNKNHALVDKSHFIPKLLPRERVVLLRPRRFGKSLTLSMLSYFFYGATDLFRDMALFNMKFKEGKFCWCPSDPKMHNFPPRPVIHLDFSEFVVPDAASFQNMLIARLHAIGTEEGAGKLDGSTAAEVLSSLVRKLASQRLNQWGKVVLLIDEYDGPLNRLVSSKENFNAITAVYKAFFSQVKTLDKFIDFALVTGITSYGLAGLYSGANNFVDATFDSRFNSICGFTKQEMVQLICEVRGTPPSESMLKALEAKYNGYSWLTEDDDVNGSRETVYNPFLIGRYCSTGLLNSFWVASSSESLMTAFPVVASVQFPINVSFSSLTNPRLSPIDMSRDADDEEVGRFLLEAGYVTIKSAKNATLLLDHPNQEVRDFIKSDFLKTFFKASTGTAKFLDAKNKILGGNGDVTALISYFNDGIESLSYLHANILQKESTWVFAIRQLLWSMDAEFGVEICNLNGRSDLLLFIGDTQYVLEFKAVEANGDDAKLQKVALGALNQVEDKKYSVNDLARNKKDTIKQTVKIALVVDTHSSKRKFALMLSKTQDGSLITTRFT